jgi:hypothetical protein
MDLVAELRRILPGEDGVRADGGEVERHAGGVFTYHDPRPPTRSSTPGAGTR